VSTETQRHWDSRYAAHDSNELSWYQACPEMSLRLLDELEVADDAAILDVGGGSSTLVDELLERRHTDVTVLDASSRALQQARARLGPNAKARWLTTDLLTWTPDRRYDVWHDRAVFHFFVRTDEVDRYRALLHRALAPHGCVVIGTFAEDGPQRCSRLPVARYSADSLAAALGPDLQVVTSRREEHVTPGGVIQPFTWLAARVLPVA
jgi:SAM-dependent methyltransferase